MKILDLTDPSRSEIPFKRWAFPDGQPHFELLDAAAAAAFDQVEIVCRIKSPADIVELALACDCLRSLTPRPSISVNVAYMLGARMDRRIGVGHPFTLEALVGLFNAACVGVWQVRVLDPHSPETLRLVRDCEPIYPDGLVKHALDNERRSAVVVIPDEGAILRTAGILQRLGLDNDVARCVKKRDSETGKLSGFALVDGDVAGRACLIVDDICDGGGTFAGIATVLRAAGARSVDLCVTHGIFSKGLRIPGIDRTFCTDSYGVADAGEYVAERGVFAAPHFVTYRRAGSVPPVLYVLTDFVRDHVRGLETP